jgi:hypothetical protein
MHGVFILIPTYVEGASVCVAMGRPRALPHLLEVSCKYGVWCTSNTEGYHASAHYRPSIPVVCTRLFCMMCMLVVGCGHIP